jgi:hypothetical protein
MATIRSLLPPPNKIFLLPDFIQRYAPSLKLDNAMDKYSELHELMNMTISPLDTIRPALHIKTPECREPVPSLVDDAIWILVQRRDRLKRMGLDGRNVLVQGYTLSAMAGPSGMQPMRPGLNCIRPNDNVSFCKSSRAFQQLHSYAGDEVFRMILLHTRLFLPVERDFNKPRGNFVLICGPPLLYGKLSRLPIAFIKRAKSNSSDETSTSGPKKKRRRVHPVTESRLKPNATISRFSLFYSDAYIPKIGLSKIHLLNDPSMPPEKLLSAMMDLYDEKGAKRRKRWKRLRVLGVDVCRDILRGHSACDYPRILQRYCALPDYVKKRAHDDSQERILLPVLSQAYTPPEKVVSFVVSVLRKVFPTAFWGSERNFDRVVGSVKVFVALRRRERLPNKILTHGVRVTQMAWLYGEKQKESKLSRSDHEAANILTLKVLRWLFRGFIIPLLRSNFYVTETEFSAKQVLYYRKPVWSLFRSLSMKKLLQNQFTELNEAEVRKHITSQIMGFSRLRLVPKTTGVRPIAQLSRRQMVHLPETTEKIQASKRALPGDCTDRLDHSSKRLKSTVSEARTTSYSWNASSRQNFDEFPSTNTVLSEVFDVLRYECGRKEGTFGVGLQGLEELYPRYHSYITSLKKRQRGSRQPLQLIFASVDIEKCYDNINQEYLLDITKRQVLHDDYFIQQFNLLYGNKITGTLEKLSKKVVGPPEQYSLIHQGHSELSDRCTHVVFDSRKCQLAKKSRIIELLKEHLGSHLVLTSGRHGNRFLVQSGGISQGSVLSMMLCNLYYGELESVMLHRENPQSPSVKDQLSRRVPDFMARLVDDFIFISTSKPSVVNFLERMYEGKPELGAKINREKSLVSTDVELEVKTDKEETHPVLVSAVPQRASNKRKLFPWCGMLFDTSTGEVFIDYERFCDGKIRDSLTVDMDGSEGQRLAVRVESFVRPRCLPLLFDCSLNTKETIVTNFYQMMLFAAVKTAEHLRSSNMLLSSTSNIGFIIRCVDSLPSYASRQIRGNLRKHCPNGSHNTFILDGATTSWLSWHAFQEVFFRLSDFPDLSDSIQVEISHRDASCDVRKISRRAFKQFQLHRMIDLCVET